MKKITLILAVLFSIFVIVSMICMTPAIAFGVGFVIISILSLVRIIDYFVDGE